MRSALTLILLVATCLATAVLPVPAVHAGQLALSSTGADNVLPAMPDPTWAPQQDEAASYGLGTQEIVTGAAIVGAALVIGLAATGSMVSGLTAAGAVLIIYSIMP